MGQALGTLLTNALRHTPFGGSVTVRATRHDPHRIALVVSDTGDGIPAEHLPQVFEHFWRGDTARDRALVEARGGSPTAPGLGQEVVFTVELPHPQHRLRTTRTSVRPHPCVIPLGGI